MVVNIVDTADPADVYKVKANVKAVSAEALILDAASPVSVDKPELVKGKRVLVIEDGPTLTHSNMPRGRELLLRGILPLAKLLIRNLMW